MKEIDDRMSLLSMSFIPMSSHEDQRYFFYRFWVWVSHFVGRTLLLLNIRVFPKIDLFRKERI